MRFRNKLLIILGLFLLANLSLASYPSHLSPVFARFFQDQSAILNLKEYIHPMMPVVKQTPMPYLRSSTFIVVDSQTNTILLSRNPHQKIYPASITKLATALTALNIYPISEIITVPQEYKEGKIMELIKDERIDVYSLITALLVYSANDAAYNLAAHHPQGQTGFVNEMNNLVKKYGLKDTSFTNFDGIHHSDHYSTAFDLSQIARLSIKNNLVREIVKKDKITVYDFDRKVQHELITTNELLNKYPEVKGLKTGWTPEGEGSFVCLFEVEGREIISVVTQSPDRFADTLELINWVKTNISWSNYFDIIESSTAGI